MSSRVLTIHLIEGTADGLQTAEIDNWIGQVFVAPKPDLPSLLKQQELQGLGVYILIGDDPSQPNRSIIYVGQGQVKDRLTNHSSDQNKDFWDNKTVAIVAKSGGSLNATDCLYLESRLIGLAHKSGVSIVKNIQAPALPHLAPVDRTKVENFLEQIQVLLPVLNISFFVQPPVVTPAAANSSGLATSQGISTPPASPRFALTTTNLTAEAELVSNKFVVRKGSLVEPNETATVGTSNSNLRSQFRANGQLVDDASLGKWVFSADVAFNSPSAAAAVICGFSIAGPQAWKVIGTQQTYRQWLQAQVNAVPVMSATP